MRTFKFVACRPLASHAVKAVPTASGFIVAASNINLVQTVAVADNEALGIKVYDLVAIRGDQVKQKWATSVYSDCQGIEGDFILIPETEVIGVDDTDRRKGPFELPKPLPTSIPNACPPRTA